VLVNQADHQIIDLIESRDEDDVIGLLIKYPNIKRITRDGSFIYARAINIVLPNAIQISDRFHLLQSLTTALKADLIMILPAIIRINEDEVSNEYVFVKLTQKEMAEINRHERNVELARALRVRYEECGVIKTVCEEFALSYRTVKKYLDNDPTRQRHDNASSLTPYFEIIYKAINEHTSPYEIFKEIKVKGYHGTFSNMLKYIRVKKSKGLFSSNCISRENLLKLLFNKGVYDLVIGKEAQERIINYLRVHKYIHSIIMLVTEFRIAIFSKNPAVIHKWIKKAKAFTELKKLQSFIKGICRDITAVENAIIYEESNGVVEGAVCKIKKVKRVHYGRCGFALLKQKILS